MEASAKIKFGSINIFESLAFLKDLYAKIAIGNSVQPKMIFLQLFFIKYNILYIKKKI